MELPYGRKSTEAFVDTPEFKFVEKKNRLKGIDGYFDALTIL
jgi:hypothetical protein